MTAPALLPRTAPFGEDDLAHLDRVLAAASVTQRAWLSGFLAGLDAGGAQAQAVPAAPPRQAEPLAILYASESGNAERLAGDAAKLARKHGFKPRTVDFADLDVADLAREKRLVVIAATWGEGEPPSRAARAYNALMSDAAPRLEGATFAVLSLGDTSYVDFCGTGKAIDARLEALGAKRAVERVDLDLDFEQGAADWIKRTLETLAPPPEPVAGNVVAVDFGGRAAPEPGRDPVPAEVVEHINLNSSRSDKETIHIALGFEDRAPAYEPGDSLEVYAENDPALVDVMLETVGLAGDDRARRLLLLERDITTLSLPGLERYAAATGHGEVKALLADGAKAWIEGRQLVDLLEAYPAPLDLDGLAGITRPLPPRAYSIASSRKEVGEEAHLLVAPVRYTAHGRARSGVASTHIADRLKVGATARVKVKPNKHFRVPEPGTDAIMIGPGTGVAPFRAFVQERRATGATGRNWLFFGDRRFTHDFLYQLEWQEAVKDGVLTRIDLAFSRDAPEKVYVQHRMWERRRELVEWLDGGAKLYVCGDAKAMARDVRAMLVEVHADVKGLSPEAAEAAVVALDRERRYLQDVY